MDDERLKDRARGLKDLGLNGIEFVIVTLENAIIPSEAFLELHFYNNNELDNILAESSQNLVNIFPISGGTRILAGSSPGQVKVTRLEGNSGESFLKLVVSPVGDYSTYRLSVSYNNIDSHFSFSHINFKFRPGCFNIDCRPEWESINQIDREPIIDYLAKDYDSFKHTMITSMMQRVPGWVPTSEADQDMVILELLCAAADELSDYQDRVMNEAYLLTAKKRVSLARHSRLMSYFIYQGNQANTYLVLNVNQELEMDGLFEVWAGSTIKDHSSVVFSGPPSVLFSKKDNTNNQNPHFYPELNNIKLYTWSDSVIGLKAGARSADLMLKRVDGVTDPTLSEVEDIKDRINQGLIPQLLIQAGHPSEPQSQNKESNRLKDKRQLLKLTEAKVITDPATTKNVLRVWWKENLNFDICTNIDLFHGNIFQVYHGERTPTFEEAAADPKLKPITFKDAAINPELGENEFHYERTSWGTICKIPDSLLYKETPSGGEVPVGTTLSVTVNDSLTQEQWRETPDLIHSTSLDKDYMVETGEDGMSNIRFGNGVNGMKLPVAATVVCSYMKDTSGSAGNVGADTLKNYDRLKLDDIVTRIDDCWNPFDVNSGRKMEAVSQIIRRVPEAYKSHQRRAITLQDYVERVEEIPGVSKASAEYQWTGSWRTVRVSVDPQGGVDLNDELRKEISNHLTARKLLGEDFEIRRAHYVPLEIKVTFCVNQDHWVEDLRYIVEQEFSTGYTPDKRPGFFNPDMWTFGQSIHRSQIIGRIESITGIDHVLELSMRRRGEALSTDDFIAIEANEIVQVENDHDHAEKGFIHFIPKGGRR
jgi:baseplate J-like protein